jgi:hypothetical protein
MPTLNSFKNQWFGVGDWVERQKNIANGHHSLSVA